MIEWKGLVKAIILVVICFFVTATVVTTAYLVFVPFEDIETGEQIFQKISAHQWLLTLLVDVGIFLGFWKSTYFFEHKKLLHISIVASVFCLPSIFSFLLYGDPFWPVFINCIVVYYIMFLAYILAIRFPKATT